MYILTLVLAVISVLVGLTRVETDQSLARLEREGEFAIRAVAGPGPAMTACQRPVVASAASLFHSKYACVHYLSEDDLNEFIWRLGGGKQEYTRNPQLASRRLDRLVNRVQLILDMWPADFRVNVHLYRGELKHDKFAYYHQQENAIYVHVDYHSDGIMAHELAHAVMHQYFDTPPPGKAQEILAQYVDRHLWTDYH